MIYPTLPILIKEMQLFSNCKLQLLAKCNYQITVPSSKLFLVFPRTVYTTRKNLIFVSSFRRKKHEFENQFATMLQSQRRKAASPLILLIDATDKIEAMTLENANKLALMKNLKLVKIEDPERYTEGNKPVYQLMTGKEYHDEIIKQKNKNTTTTVSGFKGEKAIMLSSNIGGHDLEIKIKHMISWVQKNFQIKVTITGSDTGSDNQFDSVIDKIEDSLQECGGRVLQKTLKPGHLKCFINPPKPLLKTKSNKLDTENSDPKTS